MDGSCVCPPDAHECAGSCVVESDSSCGTECVDCTLSGMQCVNGECICGDGARLCGASCATEMNSSCGTACLDCSATGEECRDGACVCPVGTIRCDEQCLEESDTVCGSECADCTLLGLECHQGECRCADGMTQCNDTCIPETDDVCGDTCTDCSKLGLKCRSGVCVCPEDFVLCDEQCQPQSDALCGNTCTNCAEIGTVCRDGECVCMPRDLSFLMFENQIDDLQLKSPDYTGEVLSTLNNGACKTLVTNALPYHRFEIKADPTPETEIYYRGRTLSGERVGLFAYDPESESWNILTSAVYMGKEDIEFYAEISNDRYVDGGIIQILVAPVLVSNGSDSILMTGDTQNYSYASVSGKNHEIYRSIMNYAKEQYEAGNVAYFHHVGDMTENSGGHDPVRFETEFRVASESHQIIDDIGMPNGITVGNHDFHVLTPYQDNYVRPYYDKYFPWTRYSDNIWYGGHYDNNYNSYTLVTIAGRDFIFLNLGWLSYPYDWGNRILDLYKHRIAVVCSHSYLTKYGVLTAQGKTIYSSFVAPHTNVLMELSGHVAAVDYNIRTFERDPKRKVYEIVVDHSNLIPETYGASGYLRWITFRDNKIINKTYSPYRDDYRTASDGAGEEWTAELILPDSQREIQSIAFRARSGCSCVDDASCDVNESCTDGFCRCASDNILCDGMCVVQSDTVCGEHCQNCLESNATCSEGACVCADDKIAVYETDGTLIDCVSECGDGVCGVGAICIDTGDSRRCQCELDGELCEIGGTCNGRICDCADELSVSLDSVSKVGCLARSPEPSSIPSQTTLAIATNADSKYSAMAFNWITDTSTASSELVYSLHPDMSDSIHVEADVQKPTAENISPDTNRDAFTPVHAYSATARDLIPNQTYYYQTGNSVDGYSEIQSFKALEPSESNDPFSFLVIPVTARTYEGAYSTRVRNLISYIKMHDRDSSFIIHTGSMVSHGYKSAEWQYFLNATKPLTDHIPIMAAVGLHDGGQKYDVYYTNYLSRFNYRSLAYNGMSSTTKNTVYSFEYGDALFMVLNSKATNNDIKAQWNYFIKSQSANTKKKWKILIYSSSIYNPGSSYKLLNEYGDLITKAGIDLVISSTETSYFRTTLYTTGTEKNNREQVIRVSPQNGSGTTYVIAGTANSDYQGYLTVDKDTSFNEVDYQIGEAFPNHAGIYGNVEVTSDYIRYTTYDTTHGNVIDTFRIDHNHAEFESSHANQISRAGVYGMPVIGNTLNAHYTPAGVAVTYQWERSEDGKTWSGIRDATGSSYTLSDADAHKYIRCTITGSGDIGGTVSSLPTKPVIAAEE